ncbi:hypothetical protein WA026_003812 [Henosepilachna vigintioctopunctata]|uniref:Uncharacterized protein n=1 Tax=Henosepilachna vigintioctopunctata TaxID=420089 RepID=A0AAW1U8P5_9CUCU
MKLRQQESEQQFEIENKMDEKRALSHDISLYNLVLDNIIPKTYRKKIDSNIKYNNNDDEYSVNHVAYAGNNILSKSDKTSSTMKNFPNRMKSPFITSRKR